MKLKSSSAPYQRSKKTTLQIMIELSIGLTIVWLFGVIFSFLEGGNKLGVNAILNMVVALVTAEACDVITALCQHKKGNKILNEILDKLSHNYSYVSAIILVLTLPAWTSLYVTFIGTVFAIIVVKNFFGGFGRNVFNPAALARIFITVSFAGAISTNASGIESIAGGTITSLVNNGAWISFPELLPAGYTLSQIFFGTYFGAIGETSTILILIVGILLAVRHDLNWRTPVFYLGTIGLSGLIIALILGIHNPLGYTLLQLSLGGAAFGGIFMLTDPVTSPTSNFGKAFIGVFAAFITMWIRMTPGSSYPEGVIFSIALANMISPVIDHFVTGKTNEHLIAKYAVTGALVVATVGLATGTAWSVNDGRNVYEIGGKEIQYYSGAEYKKLKDTIGIKLDDTNYITMSDYKPADHDNVKFITDEAKGFSSFYQIRSNKDKLVGYIYHLEITGGEIDIHGYPQPAFTECWIAVDVSAEVPTILGAKAIKAPHVDHPDTPYNKFATDAINGLGGQTSADGFENISSATETSKNIKALITATLNQAAADLEGGK